MTRKEKSKAEKDKTVEEHLLDLKKLQILALIDSGLSGKLIAEVMGVSYKTIERICTRKMIEASKRVKE